jgi:transposase
LRRGGHLSFEQEGSLKAHIAANPPRSTNEVRAHIANKYGQFISRSGAIKLMARLGFVYKKPKLLPLGANEDVQCEFIRKYDALCNQLVADEAIFLTMQCIPSIRQGPPMAGF